MASPRRPPNYFQHLKIYPLGSPRTPLNNLQCLKLIPPGVPEDPRIIFSVSLFSGCENILAFESLEPPPPHVVPEDTPELFSTSENKSPWRPRGHPLKTILIFQCLENNSGCVLGDTPELLPDVGNNSAGLGTLKIFRESPRGRKGGLIFRR